MPHFIALDRSFYISCSFKAMYSTLKLHDRLATASRGELLKNIARARLGARPRPHYFVVRSPYDRVESFYFDKFRDHPAAMRDSTEDWQDCQTLFFPYLRRSPGQSIRNMLLQTSFADVVRLLPVVHALDPHLYLQIRAMQLRIRSVAIAPLPICRLLRMESQGDLSFLAHQLSGSLERRNATARNDRDTEAQWSAELHGIVNQVYEADFSTLGYPLR